MNFTKQSYENAILELMQKHMGYDHIYGGEVVRDSSQHPTTKTNK